MSRHTLNSSSSSPPEPEQPLLLDAGSRADRIELAKLIDSGVSANVEVIRFQLRELMQCRDPSIKEDEAELSNRLVTHLSGTPIEHYGTWVYYPWNRKLLQVLPKSEFEEVRNNRNHNKITKPEQALLSTRRVGIVGLSVGHAIAQVMAMEGSASEYRLADFDTIALSNLNRLPAGVAEIGINKAVFAARRMYEIDPYLKIRVFAQGISEPVLEPFLKDGGMLDLVIDECDDLFVKLRIREVARALRIPVLMETNDRGMLDIERFDLEPTRPIFHGILGAVHSRDMSSASLAKKISFVLDLLGRDRLSPKLASSLTEIGSTLLSWPQLGSGAVLGGAVAGDAARRILTGTLAVSGRFYVDIHEIISETSHAMYSQMPEFEAEDDVGSQSTPRGPAEAT